jgi:hypothetical protein
MGSLVPIQKGRKMVEQEIFAEAAEKARVFGIELLDIQFERPTSSSSTPFITLSHSWATANTSGG